MTNSEEYLDLLKRKNELDDQIYAFEIKFDDLLSKLVKAERPELSFMKIVWDVRPSEKIRIKAYPTGSDDDSYTTMVFPVEWLDPEKFDADKYLREKNEERRALRESVEKARAAREEAKDYDMYLKLKARFEGDNKEFDGIKKFNEDKEKEN